MKLPTTTLPAARLSGEWGEFREKPVFSPSFISDFTCPLRFRLKHFETVGNPPKLETKRDLGSVVHAAEAAVNRELLNNPNNPDWGAWREGLEDGIDEILTPWAEPVREKIRNGSHIDQLREEVARIMAGGSFKNGRGREVHHPSYKGWFRKSHPLELRVLMVEERLFVDLGPIVAAPKLDLIIEYGDGLWVVELKTTGRDDAEWNHQWPLSNQLLLQLLAAEKHFGKPFQGAMIRQVVVTRQQSKKWTSSLPQPLNNIVRHPPRWVRRDPTTLALFEESLGDLRKEWDERLSSGSWPALGMARRDCQFCSYQTHCRGELPFGSLVKIPSRLKLMLAERKHHGRRTRQK